MVDEQRTGGGGRLCSGNRRRCSGEKGGGPESARKMDSPPSLERVGPPPLKEKEEDIGENKGYFEIYILGEDQQVDHKGKEKKKGEPLSSLKREERSNLQAKKQLWK